MTATSNCGTGNDKVWVAALEISRIAGCASAGVLTKLVFVADARYLIRSGKEATTVYLAFFRCTTSTRLLLCPRNPLHRTQATNSQEHSNSRLAHLYRAFSGLLNYSSLRTSALDTSLKELHCRLSKTLSPYISRSWRTTRS